MKSKIRDGLTLIAVAMAAIGLMDNARSWWKILLGISALLLLLLGVIELSSKKKEI